MSADSPEQIIARHIYSTIHYQCACLGEDSDTMTVLEHAAHQLDALRSAGYVVELATTPTNPDDGAIDDALEVEINCYDRSERYPNRSFWSNSALRKAYRVGWDAAARRERPDSLTDKQGRLQ